MPENTELNILEEYMKIKIQVNHTSNNYSKKEFFFMIGFKFFEKEPDYEKINIDYD